MNDPHLETFYAMAAEHKRRKHMAYVLYQCRSSPHGFVILKDAEEPASYHITEVGPRTMSCDCPAGAGGKPTCRHRKMIKYFIEADHVDDGWQLDWDTRQWHKPQLPDLITHLPEGATADIAEAVSEPPLRKSQEPALRYRRLAE